MFLLKVYIFKKHHPLHRKGEKNGKIDKEKIFVPNKLSNLLCFALLHCRLRQRWRQKW